MATIPITKRGAEKLKTELHRLKTVERPAVITAIAEARAQGDLSENADYDAAKDRQGFIEGRIQEIEGKLSVAQVIDPSGVDGGGKVVFGATVELEDEESGDTVKYQIVGEDFLVGGGVSGGGCLRAGHDTRMRRGAPHSKAIRLSETVVA